MKKVNFKPAPFTESEATERIVKMVEAKGPGHTVIPGPIVWNGCNWELHRWYFQGPNIDLLTDINIALTVK